MIFDKCLRGSVEKVTLDSDVPPFSWCYVEGVGVVTRCDYEYFCKKKNHILMVNPVWEYYIATGFIFPSCVWHFIKFKVTGDGDGSFSEILLVSEVLSQSMLCFLGVAIKRLRCVKILYVAFIPPFFILFTWRYSSLKVGIFNGENICIIFQIKVHVLLKKKFRL